MTASSPHRLTGFRENLLGALSGMSADGYESWAEANQRIAMAPVELEAVADYLHWCMASWPAAKVEPIEVAAADQLRSELHAGAERFYAAFKLTVRATSSLDAAKRVALEVLEAVHYETPWTPGELMPALVEVLAMLHQAETGDPSIPCCDMHNGHCEPPSELCCRQCTEAGHPEHADGRDCVLPGVTRGGAD